MATVKARYIGYSLPSEGLVKGEQYLLSYRIKSATEIEVKYSRQGHEHTMTYTSVSAFGSQWKVEK